MRKAASVVIVLTLAAGRALGCSSSSSLAANAASPVNAASAESATASAHSPSATVEATVQGSRIFGPQLELVRDKTGIRGQGPLGVVELHEDSKGAISGVVGNGTTNLHVEPISADEFNLRGLFRGALGDLEVRNDRIQGQLGHCQFDLHAAPTDSGRAYNGDRWCGRARETTTLTLSPQIAELAPLDRGALIAILLGR